MLESWNDGAAKSAIVDFVARVAREGGKGFVPPAERIATFDNDGTLWCEQPLPVQGLFLADREKQLAANDASLKERQPFKAFLEHDHATLHALGKQGLAELMFATHAGMSPDEFDAIARQWFATAKHPRFGRVPASTSSAPSPRSPTACRASGSSARAPSCAPRRRMAGSFS